MEIKLNAGDRIKIPEGCRAVIESGEIVIRTAFEDGDVLYLADDGIAILDGEFYDGSFDDYVNYSDGEICADGISWEVDPSVVRLATDEEKQELFDKMAEVGLRWNAEEKRVEKIDVKPKLGEVYYFLDGMFNMNVDTWHNDDTDHNRLKIKNVFSTMEECTQAAEVVKETLRKFHEENNQP